MEELKQLRCKAIFDSNIEIINPLFSKVKIKIAYTGTNRNNSYISKETFEKAIPTIYNCPIIGEFIETIDDFGSHGGKIEISDKGYKYIQTTKPYGVINENSEITWEDVVEADGTINTYLCATGYLWTGRYDELSLVLKESKSQSMEIEVSNGSFQDIDGKSVYAISDFVFSAFCILGNSTEPCFESSDIIAYSFSKDEFKVEFNKMLSELKQFSMNQSSILEVDNINSNNKEGGKDLVDEKLELLKKYNLTIEQLDFNLEEIEIKDLEQKLIDFSNNQKSNTEITFSATYRQKREALSNALEPKIERDEDGNIIYEEYMWVEDFDDEHVFVEKSIWTDKNHDCKYGRFTYTFDEDSLTATITSEFEEMVLVWLTLDENQKLQDERSNFEALNTKVSEFELTIETLNTEINTLKTSNEELSNYKNNNELEIHTNNINEVFSDFEESLKDNEKYIALKSAVEEDIMNFNVDNLRKDLLAILGELNFSKSNKKAKSEKIVAPVINSESNKTIKSRYGKYEQYLEKQE